MSKPLLDVVFNSEKRKKVLLLLQDGHKEMDSLLKSLDTTRQALLPQTKILEEHHLVFHYDDIYELTTLGKIIVEDMMPLIDIIEVFEHDTNYWGNHKIDFIPPFLLERLSDLKCCKIIKPCLADLYEVNKDFIERSDHSKSLFFIFTFMHPSFAPLISQFIENDIDTKIIVTKELLEKLKAEWHDETNAFIGSGKVKLFLFQEPLKLVSLSVSDVCLALRLLNNDNRYDNTQIFCCGPSSQHWGQELFNYYLGFSVPIYEV